MCRRIGCTFYSFLVLTMIISVPANAAVSIEVENFSFEIPDDGQKRDIDVGTPGIVTGWARVDPTTSAGREFGWTPTDGTATAFMGKDAVIYNLTDFLMLAGDKYQLIFDSRSTWQGSNMIADLYYDYEGERIVFATTTLDLSRQTSMGTFIVYSNSVDSNVNDHKIGIKFTHQYVEGLWPDDNIWAGLDYIELFIMSPLIRAQNPFPAHESSYGDPNVTLTWVPGPNAPTVDSYNIYYSKNRADVNEGATDVKIGSTNGTSYFVSDLVQGETYYWRIDTVIGADVYRGNIWSFVSKPLLAYNPVPKSNTEFVSLEPVLSWEAGSGAAQGYVVFLGDNFDDVNNAPTGIDGKPPFRAYLGDPTDVNWAPSEAGMTLLETSRTYYWRVDEVGSGSTIHVGDIWSFTTVPIKGLGSITRDLYEGIPGNTIAELTDDPNYPDGPSTTGYLTSFEAPHMAISEYGSRLHGWLYVRNSGEYTFWIASGENSQLWFGNHPSTASIIAFVNGEEGRDGWTQPREWDKNPETQQSEPIHLEGSGSLYYIMVLHKKGWGYDNLSVAWSGPDSNYVREIIPGISLIPADQVELLTAMAPKPAHGATDVQREPTLSWVPGEFAEKHDVYFGTGEEAVKNATKTSPEYVVTNDISSVSFRPGILEFNTSYYWRIDEVNSANPDSPWNGNVWSFTTGNFLLIDDFEDYDIGINEIWWSWKDGLGYVAHDNEPAYPGNGTGAEVGDESSPSYMEETIVHGGNKSMPVVYNNNKQGYAYYSEAELTLTVQRDWTEQDVAELSLWFRGNPASVGSFVEGPVGTYTITAAGADITGTDDEFHFAYKMLTGVGSIQARVLSVENTNEWAKAGVMIRETLDPDSKHAIAFVTPAQGAIFEYRSETGAENAGNAGQQTDISAPHWVKIERDLAGNFTASSSTNGTTWTVLGMPEIINMGVNVYIGLALTSHDAALTCEAVFSNVTTTGSVSGQWAHQDIGILSNDAEPLYVAVSNSTGNPAVVVHDDANAAQIDTWTEWVIPLPAFADQGIDLTDVDRIAIGLGTKGNMTVPGGSGKIYIDDIRLYRSQPEPEMEPQP